MKIPIPCPFDPFDEDITPEADSPDWPIYFMRCAYNQALMAWELGEIPIGAVAIVNNQIVVRAHNRVEEEWDASAHAEMQLLRHLSRGKKDWRLTDVTLYVTKEPCPMCTGAIFKARIPRVVLGTYDGQQGCLDGRLNFNEQLRLYHRVQVTTEPLNGRCELLLKAFFRLHRQAKGPTTTHRA
jgi:tRNA(adenine34) deaminase